MRERLLAVLIPRTPFLNPYAKVRSSFVIVCSIDMYVTHTVSDTHTVASVHTHTHAGIHIHTNTHTVTHTAPVYFSTHCRIYSVLH